MNNDKIAPSTTPTSNSLFTSEMGARVRALILSIPTNDVSEARAVALSNAGSAATAQCRWEWRIAHSVLSGHGALWSDWAARLGASMPWNSEFAIPSWMEEAEDRTRQLAKIRLQVRLLERADHILAKVEKAIDEAPAALSALEALAAKFEEPLASKLMKIDPKSTKKAQA